MAFLGFETLGVLGKYQEGAAFAALDRMNDRPALDGKCAWCLGKGHREFVCTPSSAPTRGHQHVDGHCWGTGLTGRVHAEICGPCEGTGLDVELGVAG